jgi:hypothetical protein
VDDWFAMLDGMRIMGGSKNGAALYEYKSLSVKLIYASDYLYLSYLGISFSLPG